MRVVTPEEMRELEARFMHDSGVESALLMSRAADGLKSAALEMLGRTDWPPPNAGMPADIPALTGIRALICCGPGANGGDGWALAWRLYDMNSEVLVLTAGRPQYGTAAYENYEQCLLSWRSIRIVDLKDADISNAESGAEIMDYVTGVCGAALLKADICVDAMFGTGLSRPLGGIYLGLSRMMHMLAANGARVLAADIPSGLNGVDGSDGGACPADVTVTFQHIKRGQLFGCGQDLCGRLICHDIGIPDAYAPADAPEYIPSDSVHMPRRRHDTHKGTYGHLIMIAGSEQFAGAALLGVKAALRSGVGLVTAACVRALRPLIQLASPPAMALEVTENAVFDFASAGNIGAALAGKTAIAIGPGLTRRAAPEVVGVALDSGLPTVIDADALNIIAANPSLKKKLGAGHVITPHIGEMARLIGRSVCDPVEDARKLAKELGCTVLLKGCATCICGENGAKAYLTAPGAVGMACGGSGDVLTGVIGALLAQGLSPIDAALKGAVLHGAAGRYAQARMGEISMNAADIADNLPAAFMAALEKR